jgi:hypothetical protein
VKNLEKVTICTVEEQGLVLPLGIQNSSGNFVQDIVFRPWRLKEERELIELRENNKDLNLASYVSLALATMCKKLGPYDFGEMNLVEKKLIISQMYLADVFYAYVLLRIKSIGNKMSIVFQPQWSNKQLTIESDLNTVEVKKPNSYKDACWTYVLKNPIEIRGKIVTEFNLAPQKWNSLEQYEELGNQSDQSSAKIMLILASVIGCKEIDNDLVLIEKELDEMSKLDIETLSYFIDENSLGPKMVVEGKHKGRSFRAPIDWGYDNFFLISSV